MEKLKVGDRVWFTGTAQWLWDEGYEDLARRWLQSTYGLIVEESPTSDKVLVSFHMFCNYAEGYTPYAVFIPISKLKFADLSPEYIAESEDPDNY
jgi:hypothetical protein